MKQSRLRRWCWTFLFLFAPSAFSQEAAPDLANVTLEQLGGIKVYSASKHLQPAQEAPSSVTVITADEIQHYGYRTLAEILQNVRGFFVTYDRNYSSVGVRGFARPGDYNTRILLLVDGHRLNDNVFDEAMIGTEFPIDIDLVKRVEVIRGPVSSLYGSNALFAVINVITKRGEDLKGLEVSSEAGSFNTYDGRLSYGSELRGLRYLISGTFFGSRGHNQLFFPEFDTSRANNGIASHADDDQFGSALATLSCRDFTLHGVYGTREKGIPTGAYGTVFNNSGTRTTDSHDYIDLRYEHEFGTSWDLVARSYYDKYTYQGTYIYASLDNPTQVDPNQDFGDGDWWGTELQVTRLLFDRHRITVGGEYRDNLHQNQDNFNMNPYSLLLDSDRHSFVGATYLQDELTISKSLAVNAGFRYDYYSYLDESKVDPRAALIYRPWSRTALKYIYGQAFRVPNVYEMYYSVPPLLPNPSLKTEKIRSNEVVWEQAVNDRLWLSTSGFYNLMDGFITAEPVNNGLQIFRNLQNVSSSGIEEEIRAQLPGGLEAAASYSFQETKDKVTDRMLSDSPRDLAKAQLSHPFLRRKVFLSLDAQYRSRIQALDGGRVSPFSLFNGTLFGRNLGKHWDLSGSVYNLLNKTYFDPPSVGNLSMPIQQDGRSFRIKLTWHSGER